jgi:hypothetical protein
MPLICSPVGLYLPSRLGAGIWWHGSPPGFSYIMAWGSYVWAEGSGVLEFCLFLVVFPSRCVSRVSARFLLYGAHTILEPSSLSFLILLFVHL